MKKERKREREKERKKESVRCMTLRSQNRKVQNISWQWRSNSRSARKQPGIHKNDI
jgi:hypothetical protein